MNQIAKNVLHGSRSVIHRACMSRRSRALRSRSCCSSHFWFSKAPSGIAWTRTYQWHQWQVASGSQKKCAPKSWDVVWLIWLISHAFYDDGVVWMMLFNEMSIKTIRKTAKNIKISWWVSCAWSLERESPMVFFWCTSKRASFPPERFSTVMMPSSWKNTMTYPMTYPAWSTVPKNYGKLWKDPPFWMGKYGKLWKDPPCYLAGKTHEISTGKIAMALIAFSVDITRGYIICQHISTSKSQKKLVWELELPAQVEKVRLFLHFFTLDFWKFWTSQVPEEQKCTATLW